jgi:hypothetical protein
MIFLISHLIKIIKIINKIIEINILCKIKAFNNQNIIQNYNLMNFSNNITHQIIKQNFL